MICTITYIESLRPQWVLLLGTGRIASKSASILPRKVCFAEDYATALRIDEQRKASMPHAGHSHVHREFSSEGPYEGTGLIKAVHTTDRDSKGMFDSTRIQSSIPIAVMHFVGVMPG